MLLRKSWFLPLLAASVGGPLLFLSEGERSTDGPTEEGFLDGQLNLTQVEGSRQPIYRPDQNLDEIFNFRLTPQVIESRWENVTRSAMNDRQIYRTSMLSGHGPSDMVGALTYEFDRGSVLRTIRFSGFVEDPSLVVQFVGSRFGFARTDGSGMEFQPTAFSGHAGALQMSRSPDYENHLRIELWVAR